MIHGYGTDSLLFSSATCTRRNSTAPGFGVEGPEREGSSPECGFVLGLVHGYGTDSLLTAAADDDELMLNVLRCHLTY